jgi:hypothetical protein
MRQPHYLTAITNETVVALVSVFLGVGIALFPTLLLNNRDKEDRLAARFLSMAASAQQVLASSRHNEADASDNTRNIKRSPKGIRIPVSALRGRRPRPLDDGAKNRMARVEKLAAREGLEPS